MASTDPSRLSIGGGRRLNPAAPMFLPRVPANNHFSWYRHYSSPPPPPPPPPPYYAAVSTARVTIQTPISYVPLYHHPHGNYYPNPSRYSTTAQPPPPPQLLRSHLSPAVTTEPDPDVSLPDQTLVTQKGYNKRQSFITRKSCRRSDPGGGFGRRAGDRRRAWRRRHAFVPVESDRQITTVMIRNIPNKYTRGLMIEFLDKHCQEMNEKEKHKLQSYGSLQESMSSAYDFFYLPMDFKSGMNKGYAFVNFTNAASVGKFAKACNNQPWDLFISRKRLEVASARIQGKDNLVRHFERMAYPTEEYAAVCFSPARGGHVGDDGASASRSVVVGKCA